MVPEGPAAGGGALGISAGPCLPGATRLWRNFAMTFPCNMLNIQSPTGRLQWFACLQAAVNGICRFAGQQSGVVTGILYPPGSTIYLPKCLCSQLGVVLKINEISMNFQYPQNHQNCLPRPPKVTKMRSQELPKVVKISKVLKKWNLMKTHVFTILLKG